MKLRVLNARESGNASGLAAYLLRDEETQACASTAIMDDPYFRVQINELLATQKLEFNSKFPRDAVEKWRARQILESDSRKVVANRERILGRDAVFKQRTPHLKKIMPEHIRRTIHLVHRLSQTQQYTNPTTARTGRDFLRPIPNSATDEKILEALRAVRDLVPAIVPAFFTIHIDNNKNKHLCGWISSNKWDKDKGEWVTGTSLDTKAGFIAFRDSVEHRLENIVGRFRWADDPNCPKVTTFHPYVRNLIKSMPHDDFVKGDFLRALPDGRLKECCRQMITRERYKMGVRADEESARSFFDTLADLEDVEKMAVGMTETVKPSQVVAQLDEATLRREIEAEERRLAERPTHSRAMRR